MKVGREEIRQKANEAIIKVLGVKPQEIKPAEKLYDSLGVDSTEMVELVIALSKAFDIKLTAKEITKFNSIDEIVEIIKNK
ncbi:MAG: acyl carrier protein [Candidatus Omnitrophota bacterium]